MADGGQQQRQNCIQFTFMRYKKFRGKWIPMLLCFQRRRIEIRWNDLQVWITKNGWESFFFVKINGIKRNLVSFDEKEMIDLHASGLVAYSARHGIQSWTHPVVCLWSQSHFVPASTSHSTDSNYPWIAAMGIKCDKIGLLCCGFWNWDSIIVFNCFGFFPWDIYLTWKILGIFARGRTRKWYFAFGNLSAITMASLFEIIQFFGSFIVLSNPSDQLPIVVIINVSSERYIKQLLEKKNKQIYFNSFHKNFVIWISLTRTTRRMKRHNRKQFQWQELSKTYVTIVALLLFDLFSVDLNKDEKKSNVR